MTVSKLRKVLDAFQGLTGEITLHFERRGLWAKELEYSKVAMLEMIVPETELRETGEEFTASVNVQDLATVLRRAKEYDEVSFGLTSDGSKLTVMVEGRASKRFRIPLIDKDPDPVPDPKITPRATVVIDAKDLRDALSDVASFGSTLTIEADGDTFWVRAEGTRGQYIYEVKCGDGSRLRRVDASGASASYDRGLLERLIKPATDEVTLRWAEDSPVLIEYLAGKIKVKGALAPQIYTR